MHLEQHTELDNLITMQNLRTSANKGATTPTTSPSPSHLLHGVVYALLEGPEKLHTAATGGGEETAAATPVVALDALFLGLNDSTGEGTTPTLVQCDGNTTYSLGVMVPRKGRVPYAVRGVCVFVQELGYTRMILWSDGEPSITALVTADQKEWAGDSRNFQTQLIPRTSPVDCHASNGAAEAMYTAFKVSRRNLLESRSCQIHRFCRGWCDIRVFLRHRFVVRSSGRTLFEGLTMSKFQSPLLNFGEAVLAKESGAQEGILGSSWDLGLWLGRSTRTNEHLVGTDCKTTFGDTQMGQRVV